MRVASGAWEASEPRSGVSGSPMRGIDPRDQFSAAERSAKAIIRAGFERGDPLLHRVRSGDRDQRDVWCHRAQCTTAGGWMVAHHEDQLGTEHVEEAGRCAVVIDGQHVVSLAGERSRQLWFRILVHEQDSQPARR